MSGSEPRFGITNVDLEFVENFDPDQPRDEVGRWADGSGVMASGKSSSREEDTQRRKELSVKAEELRKTSLYWYDRGKKSMGDKVSLELDKVVGEINAIDKRLKIKAVID